MGKGSMKLRLFALGVAMAAITAGFVSAAGAASSAKNGVRLLSPKSGTIVPTVVASGATPTYKWRVRGKGVVFFRLCNSKARDRDGQLCPKRAPTDIERGKKGKKTKKGRYYSYKPEAYTFPTYYLNTPGTYYWQAYRIACKRKRGGRLDCIQESPTWRLVVR